MDEGRTTAGQALRRFTLGSGPLKRTSDRLQFLARVLLLCGMLLAVPVALVAASVVHTQTLVQGAAQSAERRQVDAELTAEAPLQTNVAEDVPPPPARASAQWPGPLGRPHTGLVDAPSGARAGSTVRIWVDRQGDLTTRPLDDGDATGRAVSMGLGTYLLLAMLAVLVHLAFLGALDRSRLRRWAADWALTEPLWRGTVA